VRTIEEFKARHVETLSDAIKRPGMYGGDSSGVDLHLRMLLEDLCFIDERDADAAIYQPLKERHLWSSVGIRGPFSRVFHFADDFENELASVYGEMAFRLGYITPTRLLSCIELERIKRDARRFRANDIHAADIQAMFGPASLIVGGRYYQILCYGTDDANHWWLFFDCRFDHRGYVRVARRRLDLATVDGLPHWQHPDFQNPLLRNTRIHALGYPSLRQGITFTPYGQRIRQKIRPAKQPARPRSALKRG
jgi:hypothetical protein